MKPEDDPSLDRDFEITPATASEGKAEKFERLLSEAQEAEAHASEPIRISLDNNKPRKKKPTSR